MAYIVVLTAVVLAAVMVTAIMEKQLTDKRASRLRERLHARSQQPLWTDATAKLSGADMKSLRRRKKEISNSRTPSYMTKIQTGDSSLLSDRLIADNTAFKRQLKSSRFANLQAQIEELAEKGWTQNETDWWEGFLLDPERLDNMTEPADIVNALLTHARQTTPEFSVPYLTPRIVVEKMPSDAGQFVVEGGWVTIKLSSKFFDNRSAARAILVHEVCHYILNNSGFRKRDVALNERYTDICMFVCGFGKLFLDGYQKYPAQRQYRPGHRLGYLSDMEYAFIYQYVMALRKQYKKGLRSQLSVLQQTLLRLVRGDRAMLERLVSYERTRTPSKSEAKLYENAISRLQRQ